MEAKALDHEALGEVLQREVRDEAAEVLLKHLPDLILVASRAGLDQIGPIFIPDVPEQIKKIWDWCSDNSTSRLSVRILSNFRSAERPGHRNILIGWNFKEV